MKIEKINENSIEFTMDVEDLRTRNLKLNDLTYGSEKIKELFLEVADVAKEKLNFVIDAPIAVEAVPQRDGTIKLIITKVFEPDELDARFSRFTPTKGEPMPFAIMQLLESTIDKFEDAIRNSNQKSLDNTTNQNKLEIHGNKEIVAIFEFSDIDKASDAVKDVSFYDYDSVFYKDEKNSIYYLVINIKSNSEKEILAEFNKVCNSIAEYGKRVEGHIGMNKAYYDEHYKIIIKNDAVKKLSML